MGFNRGLLLNTEGIGSKAINLPLEIFTTRHDQFLPCQDKRGNIKVK